MFDSIRTFLQNKKTYILLICGACAVIVDYFGGIGLTDACKAQIQATNTCSLTLTDVSRMLGELGVLATLRAAIGIK